MELGKKMWLKGSLLMIIVLGFGLTTFIHSYCLAEKPESFPIAIIADLTGPYAPVVGPFAPGGEDAVKFVNEQLGGIDGVKLKLFIRDNAGNVSLGLQQYVELIEMKPKPHFFGVILAPLAEPLREKFVTDKVIGYVSATTPAIFPVGNSYGYSCLYPEQQAAAVRWAKEQFKEKRNLRAAIITWDTAFGRSILIPEFLGYCKKIGVDIVAQELFGIRDVDITTQMARIRGKEPDWLVTSTSVGGCLAIMKAAKELGMNVKMLNGMGLDWTTAKLAPELFQGCIGVQQQISMDDTNHPGVKKILEYIKIYNRGEKEKTMTYCIGWEYVLMIHKVVTAAVAKVGWDKLDVYAIKKEMNSLRNFEPLDGLSRYTYTDKRPTTPWMTVLRVEGGKFVNVKPGGGFVEVPDLTPAAYR